MCGSDDLMKSYFFIVYFKLGWGVEDRRKVYVYHLHLQELLQSIASGMTSC